MKNQSAKDKAFIAKLGSITFGFGSPAKAKGCTVIPFVIRVSQPEVKNRHKERSFAA